MGHTELERQMTSWKKSRTFILADKLVNSDYYYYCCYYYYYYYYYFEMKFRSCYPRWSAMARSWLTETSASWVQAILLPQPPE